MSKHRVCINGMTENEQIRGPVRYIYEIASNMPTSNFDVYLVAGVWQKSIYESLENKVTVIYFDINRSKISRALFCFLYMPFLLSKYEINIYHIPDTNPFPLFKFNTKVISTIHDCAEYIIPHRFSVVQAFYRKVISRIQAKLSDSIITVSESSSNDIMKYHNIAKNKISMIYNGITKLVSEKVESPDCAVLSDNDFSYILYVGVLEKEKNVERLVEAFSILDESVRKNTKLYLVGKKGNAYQDIIDVIEKYSIQNDVVVFGYVDDKELKSLYENALIFAYLSEYEGFGLPILEAMQYGIPVLTSNKSSLKEIAGDAALLSETSVAEIKNNLSLLLVDEQARINFSHKGLSKTKEFSWLKAAEDTELLYCDLI